jgi:mutator protein MutT
MSEEFTPVAIALIERGGHYLIRKRPPIPGSPMPGYWEFPGGKCHHHEPPAACVMREVMEEAGLALEVLSLRRVIRHVYPHGAVELHFFDCVTSDPAAEPMPGTGFIWVPAGELNGYTFPGANDAIVEELAEG